MKKEIGCLFIDENVNMIDGGLQEMQTKTSERKQDVEY